MVEEIPTRPIKRIERIVIIDWRFSHQLRAAHDWPVGNVTNFWYIYCINILNMGKNTSISLGDHFESFIHNEIKSGRYGSVSEVIRTALRLLESEERKLNDVRNALIAGEQSARVEDFNPAEHLKLLHRKHIKK